MKPFLVILPFHRGDWQLAFDLLEWIRELGGATEYPLLLLGACNTLNVEMLRITERAKGVFGWVEAMRCPPPDAPWPVGPNLMFRHACMLVRTRYPLPFLWLEPDCVPLKPGWLDVIAGEYATSKKPFMGHVREQHSNPDLPTIYLPGCSVYPPNAENLLSPHWEPVTQAWDVTTAKASVPLAMRTGAIYEWWGRKGLPPTFKENRGKGDSENMAETGSLPKSAVLFHRCKDGSLARELRAKRGNQLTVVITNWKRPGFLWAAFESCREAGMQNIVVTSSSAGEDVEVVHDRIRAAHPTTVILSERGDSGSNASWLRGVEAVNTPWVQILHDDDLLLPDYRLVPHRLEGVDFACWDGTTHGNVVGQSVRTFPGLSTGLHRAVEILPGLMHRPLAPSPVAGCFRRERLIETLDACSTWGQEFYYRQRLLVGNDFLIWLKAARECGTFFYLPRPLISYGNHTGSATCESTARRDGKLFRIYQRVKDQFEMDYDNTAQRHAVCH